MPVGVRFSKAVDYTNTLVYRIEVQAQINMQVGEFLKGNKRAMRNKPAGETSCKKLLNVQDLIYAEIQLSEFIY